MKCWVGFRFSTHLTKSRNGSSRFDRAATSDMVVLSPPGIIKPSHCSSSAGVRTSIKDHLASVATSSFVDWKFLTASRRRLRCSRKAPWRARTPTVMFMLMAVKGGR